MKRLKQTLGQMMNGLGAQYAGEYLTKKQKHKALSLHDEAATTSNNQSSNDQSFGRTVTSTRRIA